MKASRIIAAAFLLVACERDQNLGNPNKDAGGDTSATGAAGTSGAGGAGTTGTAGSGTAGSAGTTGAAGSGGSTGTAGGAGGGVTGSGGTGGGAGGRGGAGGGAGGRGGAGGSTGGMGGGAGSGGSTGARGGAGGCGGNTGGLSGTAGGGGRGGAAGGTGGGGGTGGAGTGGAGRGGMGGTGGTAGGLGGSGGSGGQTAACGNNRIDPGEICLGSPVRLATATPANVRIGRFDADAHLDVLVYSLMGRLTQGAPAILYGAGNGTFTAPQAVDTLGTQAGGLDVADIDGNGTDDLVAGSFNGNLIGVVRTGQGTGRGLAYAPYMATNYQRGFAGVAIGRLPASISQPADALPDILALSKERLVGPPERFLGHLELFPATATGMFGPSALTNVSGPNSGPLTTLFELVDMDGSGAVDVVKVDAYSKSINVLFDLLTPQYRSVSMAYEPGNVGDQTPVGPGAVIEDFDGDGARDISAAQPIPIGLPQPAIYWGNKVARSFSTATALGITPVPYIWTSWAVAGDMNNDGIMDLIVGALESANPSDSSSSRIGIYLGRGQRSFERLVLIDLPGIVPLDCAVADVNEDGVSDLVFGTFSTSELYVLLSMR
jgi:hypothetical protein